MGIERRTRTITCALVALGSLAGLADAQCLHWPPVFGQTSPDGSVLALASIDDGSGRALYVGGSFLSIAYTDVDTDSIARWDGTTWSGMGVSGFNDPVRTIIGYDDGNGVKVYAGGLFTQSGSTPLKNVARWNGTSWQALQGGILSDGGTVSVAGFCEYDDGTGKALYVAGNFALAGTVPVNDIAKWTGHSWQALGSGLQLGFNTGAGPMCVFDDGTGPALYVTGNFTQAGGQPANHIARWNGQSWSTLGSGVDGFDAYLVVYDDGSGTALYAGSGVASVGAVNIARWDGQSWSAVGPGVTHAVSTLGVYDDGSGPALYAGSPNFAQGGGSGKWISRWDGTSWTELGDVLKGSVQAMTTFTPPGGREGLYVGGGFNVPYRKLAVWQGCTEPIEAFCFGDGTFAPCPCGNAGGSLRGCGNATGRAALLKSSGSANPDTLSFTIDQAVPSVLAVLLQGTIALTGFAQYVGDGVACIGGNVLRPFVTSTDASGAAIVPGAGDPSLSQRSAQLGDPLAPGAIRYYQLWYRDNDPAFCPPPRGAGSNLTNGMRVVW